MGLWRRRTQPEAKAASGRSRRPARLVAPGRPSSRPAPAHLSGSLEGGRSTSPPLSTRGARSHRLTRSWVGRAEELDDDHQQSGVRRGPLEDKGSAPSHAPQTRPPPGRRRTRVVDGAVARVITPSTRSTSARTTSTGLPCRTAKPPLPLRPMTRSAGDLGGGTV